MCKYWSKIVENIKPYVPGEQPQDKKYIKLNTNENPYSPSVRVIEAIRQAANDSLRLYPDPVCKELRETIARYYNLKKEEVFVGNGSDELLALSFLAFFNPGDSKPILFPDITYSFYPVYAELFGVNYELALLDRGFSIPVDAFSKENGGIIFPNPNAPTGKSVSVDFIEQILQHNSDSVVIVDEAYVDFGCESAVRLVDKYPNLLVVQTLSKSRSLAGLRIGFALGDEDLIEGLDRIKNSINSYTLDRIALAGAIEAFKDDAYFQETRQKVIATRERTSLKLGEMGFNVIPSQANFVFVSHPLIQASKIYQQLKDKGILVRHFNKPRIENFLRVSIGSDEEMDCFLRALNQITATH